MTTFKHCAALLTAVLAAGCAATDRRADEGSAAAAPREAANAAPATAANVLEAGQVKTVDVRELAHASPGVICRDVLRPGSNVLVTYCMTPEGWRAYKRRQEQEGQEILRTLQGSPYR